MLTVTHNDQTELISKYQNLTIDEEVNGTFTVSFTSFFHENNPGHALLEEEAIIIVEGYDFRVKQMKESNLRKEVTAISTFYDLVGHRQEEIYGGTRTFNQFADYVFNGTGWTYTSDVSGSVLIPNFGDNNVIKLVQALCVAFECEYKILPNKHVHFAKQIGPDNDAQYRYGHNVKALSKSVDTTNLRTKITGYGGDGLKVTYTSPLAETYGIIEAEPVRDERFTIANSLTEHIKKELTDYPEVAFELDAVELTDKELGERVWLIYEPMNIEFQSRIIAKKSGVRNGRLVTLTVTLGNTTPKTLSDILTSQSIEIDENRKETRSRFEQTNEMIELAVERFDGEITEAYSYINLTADSIRQEVGNVAGDVAALDIKADNIALSVSKVDDRLGDAESQINIQAGQISSKVSQSDYNGTEIVSMINQTPSYIEISASKINLRGAVTVLSDITGDLGNIYAGNISISNDMRIGNALHLGVGGQRSIRFNGTNAWIYNEGDFSLTLGASHVYAQNRLYARSAVFGSDMPVVTGTSSSQNLSIGLTPDGRLRVYRSDGSYAEYQPN